MRYQNVTIESLHHALPTEVVSSEAIERRLAPLYERMGLREGRLELMSGIKERRFWPAGAAPGTISAETARHAIEQSGIDVARIGSLIHASVCRDYLEPATACGVHHRVGLRHDALIFDLSNACLGFLNAIVLTANMIELGQIEAGVVVATETARDLVEATIDELNRDAAMTRNEVKLAFASLTIGSGSAACVLAHHSLSRTGHRLIGGSFRSDTASHPRCQGGPDAGFAQPTRPRMRTDSEVMLNEGCALAQRTWHRFLEELQWDASRVDHVFCHQVGIAHRRALHAALSLDPAKDFATVEWLGNMGSVALPVTASIAIEKGRIVAGGKLALLGIGSGLNCIMLGAEWNGSAR